MSRLTLYQEDKRIEEHVLMRAVVSLGRHSDNDIVLNDLSLSRFHARIERRGDRYVVVDLGSQNGVHLNGVRISGEAAIRPGDRIGMGRFVGVFNEGADRRVRASDPPLTAATKALSDSPLKKPAKDRASRLSASESERPARQGPVLYLTHHGKQTDRFQLDEDAMVIGRSQRCDIVIGLLALSRRHARVQLDDSGEWIVEDLGSQNGTYLNDQQVVGPTVLHNGDTLNFFEYALHFKASKKRKAKAAEPKRRAKKAQAKRSGASVDPPPAPKRRKKSSLKKKTLREMPERLSLNAARDEAYESSFAVSEVIELSVSDVEELAPDGYDPLFDTRADRNFMAGDSVPPQQAQSQARKAQQTGSSRVMRSWPGSADAAMALASSQRPSSNGHISVAVDGKVLTEVPLSLGPVRIGSDARCDVALPPLPGIAPWHLLITQIGDSVLMVRIGEAAAPRIAGRAVYQAFLLPDDSVELGRVVLSYLP